MTKQKTEPVNKATEESPTETLEWIIAENPNATKEQIERLFLDEVRSSRNLQEAIFDSVFEYDYNLERNSHNH